MTGWQTASNTAATKGIIHHTCNKLLNGAAISAITKTLNNNTRLPSPTRSNQAIKDEGETNNF